MPITSINWITTSSARNAHGIVRSAPNTKAINLCFIQVKSDKIIQINYRQTRNGLTVQNYYIFWK